MKALTNCLIKGAKRRNSDSAKLSRHAWRTKRRNGGTKGMSFMRKSILKQKKSGAGPARNCYLAALLLLLVTVTVFAIGGTYASEIYDSDEYAAAPAEEEGLDTERYDTLAIEEASEYEWPVYEIEGAEEFLFEIQPFGENSTTGFVFYKTGWGLSTYPRVINYRGGAVFYLYQWDGANWERYWGPGATAVTQTSAAPLGGDPGGRVDFGDLPAGYYRLRETTAPAGYYLPAGYWTFWWDGNGNVLDENGFPARPVAYTFPGSPPNLPFYWIERRVGPEEEWEYAWHVGNSRQGSFFLEFFKTDWGIYAPHDPFLDANFLYGARFSVEVQSPGGPGIPGGWQFVGYATSAANGHVVINFHLPYAFNTVRLWETISPEGFALPRHYWEIWIDENTGVYTFQRRGQNPEPIQLRHVGGRDHGEYFWHVGNRSEFSFPFEFYKTDHLLYDASPRDTSNRIVGAGFELYRWYPFPQVPVSPGQYIRVSYAVSDSAPARLGRVYFQLLRPQHPSQDSTRYRIYEIEAPERYMIPGGHWAVEVDYHGNVTITPHGENYDMGLYFYTIGGYTFVGNRPHSFRFYKTDAGVYDGQPYEYLPDAWFYIYRDERDTGAPDYDWQRVRQGPAADDYRVTSYGGALGTGRVEFATPLSRAGVYRLIEARAPIGFETPTGYWRLVRDEAGNILDITHHGGNLPFIVLCDYDGIWRVGNRALVLFEFFKTEEDALTRRDGAVFRLYRRGDWCPFEDDYHLYYVTTVTSGACGELGRAEFWLTPDDIYHLRETVAPTGFAAPSGHWTIQWDDVLEEFLITYGENPNFVPVRFPCLDCTDCDNGDYEDCEDYIVVLHLPNFLEALLFSFHKANQQLYSQVSQDPNVSTDWAYINQHFLLSGAEFSFFLWNDENTSPTAADDLVSSNNSGGTPWLYVGSDTSSGDANQAITFPLDKRFRYFQLVETKPPPGFEMPYGQWRIILEYDIDFNDPLNQDLGWDYKENNWWIRIEAIGDSTIPAFARHPADSLVLGAGDWYVGNRLILEIPLLGGVSRNAFLFAGAFTISLPFAGLGVQAYRVKHGRGRGARPGIESAFSHENRAVPARLQKGRS